MSSTTAQKTVEVVRSVFASYELPVEVVTDNGPQFACHEFQEFLRKNGVKHMLTPPYHPQSNGAADRVVQTVKKALLKSLLADQKNVCTRSVLHKIDNFLFSYRMTPHFFTGKTPSELFLGRKLRTRLSILNPNMTRAMQTKMKSIEKSSNKRRGTDRTFSVGDAVMVKSVRGESVKWFRGKVIKVVSNVTFLVRVQQRIRFVHADHLRTANSVHILCQNRSLNRTGLLCMTALRIHLWKRLTTQAGQKMAWVVPFTHRSRLGEALVPQDYQTGWRITECEH